MSSTTTHLSQKSAELFGSALCAARSLREKLYNYVRYDSALMAVTPLEWLQLNINGM
jgi:hypothetical protein